MYTIMFIPQVYEESITVLSFPQSFLFFSCFQISNSNMEKALASEISEEGCSNFYFLELFFVLINSREHWLFQEMSACNFELTLV